MRSFITLAATAAALVPAVAAAPEPNTFQIGFTKHKTVASPARLARRQTSKTVNTAISNEENLYLINITVGTPPQKVGLQLDTGSSDIWIPASNSSACRDGGCVVGSYDAGASSTYSDPGYGIFQISYVDNTEILGQYVSDVLTIGGVSLTNITMASATDTGGQYYGIMGISFDADESGDTGGVGSLEYPNIVSKLVSEGKINSRSYSLWLDDLNSNTGSILFGGVDSSKYTGDLVAIPIQLDATSGTYSSFTVAWTGLEVIGGSQTTNLNPSSPQGAILDSGTTELLLPDDIANSIFNGVGVVTNPEIGNIVPCSLANDDLSFIFQFGGSNGPKINVSVSEFVLPLDGHKFKDGPYKGQEYCQFGIEAAGQDPILFGDTFLRSAYVAYDLDNYEIGLAQANFNGNTDESSSVKVFSASAGIPGAASTVTGVVVSATASDFNPVVTSATATGDVGSGTGVVTRTPTFSLVTGAATAGVSGSSSSSSSSHNAAPSAPLPSIQRSTIAVFGITVAAFLFGTTLL